MTSREEIYIPKGLLRYPPCHPIESVRFYGVSFEWRAGLASTRGQAAHSGWKRSLDKATFITLQAACPPATEAPFHVTSGWGSTLSSLLNSNKDKSQL